MISSLAARTGPTDMTKNPYLLDLPAVVSFSGGRTSAFMLRKILDAFGGTKPEDLLVCFQNTGLEHQATYRFVHEVETRWDVPIVWLEYAVEEDDSPSFRVVDYESANRDGKPFDALIEKWGFLPNPVSRICTYELKVRTQRRYLATLPAFDDGYTIAVGLRADEPRRATRLKGDLVKEDAVAPMYHAGHAEEDVLAFWRASPFDLELPLTGNMAGNCVGCFLKSNSKLYTLEEEMPEYFDWWVQAEERMRTADGPRIKDGGRRFRKDRPPYAAIREANRQQGKLFPIIGDDDTIPCMCTD
jgi:3'-phosphoadenosine 5'-phosphosulfate sulfotransferase (PAPS reductase)/FAD synthetase